MKYYANICELNPFHNGHKYLFERIKSDSGCDKLICIMSGSFTQRGEPAIANKYVRARHAILGGADCVLELPAAFSVAPAEIFAKGAVKILKSIPAVKVLSFGCETCADFSKEAKLLLNESEKFSEVLNKNLAEGRSYVKSYTEAYVSAGGNRDLLENSNNILAMEYAKANLGQGGELELQPIERVGANFNDEKMNENFSSASAIRNNLTSPLVKENLPEFVYKDIDLFLRDYNKFQELTVYELLKTDSKRLKRLFGCGEGLENKLKTSRGEYCSIIESCTSRRYSASRIKRILCANLLGLFADECFEFLDTTLYLKPLAVKKDCADEILSELSKSVNPLILRGRDCEKLNETAKKCLKIDEFSTNLRNFITKEKTENKILTI